MNGSWADDLEVSLDEATWIISEDQLDHLNFRTLSLYFEIGSWHILLPQKGSLRSISNRDVFILYYFVKKYRINQGYWINEYMIESVQDSNPSTSLPYGLLISRIQIEYQVNLSGFQATEIFNTYDSRIIPILLPHS